jgi:hypothetical protein
MAILLKLGEGARESKEYRLMVKERIYRFSEFLTCMLDVD